VKRVMRYTFKQVESIAKTNGYYVERDRGYYHNYVVWTDKEPGVEDLCKDLQEVLSIILN